LANPNFFTGTKVSALDSIDNVPNVADLVSNALNSPTECLGFNCNRNRLSPEQLGIKVFVNHMGKDLTGPNYDTSYKPESIEKLAKRAKSRLFGADKNDIKSITADL